MSNRAFMILAALLALLFGLVFLLIPAQMTSAYGYSLGEGGLWTARYLGSALLGIGLLTWVGSRAAHGYALRGIILGDFVTSATGLVVAILQVATGSGNSLVWLNVGIYAFLTLGFAYYQFVKPVSI